MIVLIATDTPLPTYTKLEAGQPFTVKTKRLIHEREALGLNVVGVVKYEDDDTERMKSSIDKRIRSRTGY